MAPLRRALWVLAMVVGCSVPGTGLGPTSDAGETSDPVRVEARLSWTLSEASRPPGGSIWLHAVLLDGSGRGLERQSTRYDPDAGPIVFEDLGIEREMTIAVSLTSSRDPESQTCCRGVSSTFDTEAGRTESVTVPMDLVVGPLTIDGDLVSWIWAPVGASEPRELEGNRRLPAGPYSLIAPTGYLSSGGPIGPLAFRFFDIPLLRVEFTDTAGEFLGESQPGPRGEWEWTALTRIPKDGRVYAEGVFEGDRRTEPTLMPRAWHVATSRQDGSRQATPITLNPGPELGAPDGLEATGSGWQPKGLPDGRWSHAMAFDSVRRRVVLFGGLTPTGDRGATWEWDGEAWSLVANGSAGPSPRYGHAMAFDESRGRIVLFGGIREGRSGFVRPYSDTWEWDGRRWRRFDSRVYPSARYRHAMAYDRVRQRIVLYGGSRGPGDSGEDFDDTWEFDGAEWTRFSPSRDAPVPPGRNSHKMAFDAERGVIVLFGGFEERTSPGRDTWEYDGSAWTRIAAARGASSRWGHGMAFDESRGRVVVYGGLGGLNRIELLSDIREWDGNRWAEVRFDGAAPPPRYHHAMARDPVRGKWVMFGGIGETQGLGMTWEWDGNEWRMVAEQRAAPAPRTAHATAYDPNRDRVVLFGGRNDGSIGDTWEWHGQGWNKVVDEGGVAPAPRSGHAMVFDGTTDRVLLFGGQQSMELPVRNDLWGWTGNRWVQSFPEGPSPPPRTEHAMVYDEDRGHVLLFGGMGADGELADTWTFDGVSWTRMAEAGPAPPARSGHAMTYDHERRRVVLFAGAESRSDNRSDTWEWDGTQWMERHDFDSIPPARYGHTLFYDAPRETVMLFGGLGPAEDARWEWDGLGWASAHLHPLRPTWRHGHSMSVDQNWGRAVLFGGRDDLVGPRSDTWTYAPLGSARWEVASPTSRAAVDVLEFTAYCRSADTADPSCSTFVERAPRVLVPMGIPGDEAGVVRASIAGEEARSLLVGDAFTWVAEAESEGPVAIDYLELRIGYRLQP